MAIDLSVLGRMKTKADFDREAEEFDFRRAQRISALQAAEVARKKATEIDADKLGEQAFLKAAQGLPLTPQEEAAARFVDAKSGGISFNPVTGEMMQKPRLSDRIGLPGDMAQSSPAPRMPMGGNSGGLEPIDTTGIAALDEMDISGGNRSPMPPPAAPNMPGHDNFDLPNEYDSAYNEALSAARGNPRLTQEIKANYLKSKTEFNENQAKAAGFADRMLESNPIVQDPSYQAAGQSMKQRALDAIPFVGNYLVSDDYQSFNQAQRDFINAQLRRESGAVISDQEFANARKQYFPQPGDSEQVLAQKERNRQAAVEGMIRSAGPAYKAPQFSPITTPKTVDIGKLPMSAVRELKADPSPEARAQFDEVFGQGAAQKILGK